MAIGGRQGTLKGASPWAEPSTQLEPEGSPVGLILHVAHYDRKVGVVVTSEALRIRIFG